MTTEQAVYLIIYGIVVATITRLVCWAEQKKRDETYEGAIIINVNDPTKAFAQMDFYASPLDFDNGDVMKFVVRKHYISSVEEGKEEKNEEISTGNR